VALSGEGRHVRFALDGAVDLVEPAGTRVLRRGWPGVEPRSREARSVLDPWLRRPAIDPRERWLHYPVPGDEYALVSLRTPDLRPRSMGPRGAAGAFVTQPHGIVVEKDRGSLVLMELPSGRQVRSFPGPAAGATALALSADEKVVVAGYDDGTLAWWDLASARLLGQLPGRGSAIPFVAIDTEDRLLFSCDGERVLEVRGF
jgi:hypothetical protein